MRAAGAAAAALVGGATLAASFRCGATLLAFYFSGSRLTELMEERKVTDDAFKAGGQRDWVQARTLEPSSGPPAYVFQTIPWPSRRHILSMQVLPACK